MNQKNILQAYISQSKQAEIIGQKFNAEFNTPLVSVKNGIKKKKMFGQLDEAGVSSLFPGKGHLKKFKAFFTNFEKEIQSCYQQETYVV